jgi:hypothetical protein
MKTGEHFFSMVGFHLRLLPRFILPMVLLISLSASIHGILAIVFRAKPWIGEIGGIVTTLNALPIMFYGLIGIQFFLRETGWAGTVEGWLMPAGEFLFTRPIPRRSAYISRMSLYFVILLLPPLLNVGLTTIVPDLRISLYHSKTQSTEGAEKLNLYQEQFANGLLIHEPKEGHDTFVIPWGAVLVAFWQLWLATLLALALQTATLLTLPSKLQIGLFMVICLAPMFVVTFRLLGDPTIILEKVFFLFVDHWALVALLTLEAFIFVQCLALKRIQHLEII